MVNAEQVLAAFMAQLNEERAQRREMGLFIVVLVGGLALGGLSVLGLVMAAGAIGYWKG